jgi:hypothetical protein
MDRRGLLNDPEETQRLILDGRQSTMWTALPAMVTKVNLTAMTLECQPTIQGQTTDANNVSTYVNLPKLVDVPIVFPSAGGFTITFPVAVGDECLVIFASRCIDAWWQQGGIQLPIEARMHDLSDGFAFLGPKSQPNVIGSISATDLQIRNNAGSSFISIGADGTVKITAPSFTFDGNLNVTGNIVASGEVTAQNATTPIPLSTHLHPGVTTGGADTGAPIP